MWILIQTSGGVLVVTSTLISSTYSKVANLDHYINLWSCQTLINVQESKGKPCSFMQSSTSYARICCHKINHTIHAMFECVIGFVTNHYIVPNSISKVTPFLLLLALLVMLHSNEAV